MLCVSIACGSHTRMIKERENLENDGIELVELRLDILRKEPDFHRLLPNRKAKVIITARRPEDGGFWKDSEEKRLRTLREAVIAGVEYVDLEMDVAQKIPRYGQTQRIVSYHNMRETPNLEKIYEECVKGDPDIIKIAVMPNSIDDVFRMIEFLREKNAKDSKIPTIGISMSEFGSVTRILANKFGVPFTYASFSDKRDIAPGMFYYKTLRDLYRFNSINDQTEVYGIVADPIGHSLSPLLHNLTFHEHKLNKVYIPFRVKKEEINRFMDQAQIIDLKGLSVTIPHKVEIMKSLTDIDPAVKAINACNTIIIEGSRRYGHNTDYLAAVLSINGAMAGKLGSKEAAAAIENLLSGKSSNGRVLPLEGQTALVLGAGGAGKALAYGLKTEGADVIMTDGIAEAGENTAQQFGYQYCPWEQREHQDINILVNCTPIGMYPNVDKAPISKTALHAGMIVFDAVYNPEYTWLIRMAKEQGCIVVPGMEMFVGQAILQFKYFTNEKASFSFMRDIVKNALSASKD